MNRHISGQFDSEMDSAKRLLIEMGALVEQQVGDAGEAFFRHSDESASRISQVEDQVNAMEKRLDDACVQIIALRQPTATDLRTMIAVMRSSTDLERIGDEAEKIAKLARKLSRHSVPADQYSDLRKLHAAVEALLFEALDAVGRGDADKALRVIAMDAAVDELYRAIHEERARSLAEGVDNVDIVLAVLWAARGLERIGDHAKNICEYIVYAVRGKDVRHSGGASTG